MKGHSTVSLMWQRCEIIREHFVPPKCWSLVHGLERHQFFVNQLYKAKLYEGNTSSGKAATGQSRCCLGTCSPVHGVFHVEFHREAKLLDQNRLRAD